MAQYLFNNKDTFYVYDFSKPRVRATVTCGNKTWCDTVDKFEMVYCLDYTSSYYEMFLYDICKYAEIKDMLLKRLEEKQFANVKIIK